MIKIHKNKGEVCLLFGNKEQMNISKHELDITNKVLELN